MPTKVKSYQTTAPRIILALLIGAALGAAFTTGDYLINLYQTNGPAHFDQYGLSKGSRVFQVSYVIWLIGITVFGCPAWLLLHSSGYRHWLHAAVSGASIPFAIIFFWSTGYLTGRSGYSYSSYSNGGQQWENGVLTSFGWKMAAFSALQYAAIGLIIAVAIWFVAYKRSKVEPQSQD